ncbi:ATPase [Paraburkholderia susongensis]|uniref:Capsular polysaccharide transport system ATP-binding protein n=1 Tax=Paraburkholderia susongensis TaxID=1515439 RepID=A0A1X7I3E7_9BURK|nr:ATPase [Paraburkholderia susongensis]SMG08941.1 capsular polysaccharide transport system ATP-binding protein [Paraburkholderia susongensis]
MISLNGVTDTPYIFGAPQPLLQDVDLCIPRGRYALLSRRPEFHRAIVDIVAGLRPPREGFVEHKRLVSWPLGRQGFVRGKPTGLRMIEFVCALYGMESTPCVELVSDLLTSPEYLPRSMEHWPLYVRQEFSFALALVPDFDVYVVEGTIPFEECRFTNLWLALFEERLVGRTLILSTYRHQQMMDYCTKGLVYEQYGLRIDDDLGECIRRFPPRRSRSESGTPGESGEDNVVDIGAGDQFGI